MARFTRLQVIDQMKKTGLVPLFYHKDVSVAKKVLQACYKGGARLLEFTHRGDFAQEVFRELILFVNDTLPEMILGVGSVTDAAAASNYMMIGANFVVTPVFREDIAIVCNRRKVLWSPGCGTLTEIAIAEERGAEIVKLFPGNIYGPEFVKAIKGPQPWTSIMPTGGVNTSKENLKSWFDAGVTCVGLGSQLISNQVIEQRDFEGLKVTVSQVLQTIQSLK
ncbi:MAG: bifunctional 4-hydroxy-2-oxoglutarate aldolase/2-dehydro-3-deoxy-phosphogluconate aldolase [Gammaproteobacteria bacterium]|jgi:2-dehydro-3-deoxyphosphogluconate aldolase / (4S)-4-hydroxy-2-oxoglutarate aldolase|tara:strand:- start:11140 stop:11805 length:666 start_codon:yes stop_codon:yes gene_type:complete